MTARGDVAAVVLAGGRGRRMHSVLPKVLHEAAGRPLLAHVLAAVAGLSPARCVVVVGHGAETVRARFPAGATPLDVEFAHQERQLGTADALATAGGALAGWPGDVLVVNGDDPLVEGVTLARIVEAQRAGGSGMTMLTYEVADPRGLGRVLRDADGRVTRIVEERDADEAERSVREVNPGCYVFDDRVWGLMRTLDADNAAGEFYLTDVVGAYLAAGLPVRAVRGSLGPDDPIGVNDPEQLARVERVLIARARAAAPGGE